MDFKQGMNEVKSAMKSAQPSISNHFNLVLLNGQFYCQPKKHTSPDATVLSQIDRKDLEAGCTSAHWSVIEAMVRSLVKGNRI